MAVAAELIIAAVANRFVADLLYGVSPYDPAVFGTIAVGVLAVASVASLLPARRAIRVPLGQALRAD